MSGMCGAPSTWLCLAGLGWFGKLAGSCFNFATLNGLVCIVLTVLRFFCNMVGFLFYIKRTKRNMPALPVLYKTHTHLWFACASMSSMCQCGNASQQVVCPVAGLRLDAPGRLVGLVQMVGRHKMPCSASLAWLAWLAWLARLAWLAWSTCLARLASLYCFVGLFSLVLPRTDWLAALDVAKQLFVETGMLRNAWPTSMRGRLHAAQTLGRVEKQVPNGPAVLKHLVEGRHELASKQLRFVAVHQPHNVGRNNWLD